MLDHLEIHTRHMADCVGFYRAVLEPLGYSLVVDGDQKGFGHGGRLDFWLVEGEPSAEVHHAFAARDWKSVRAAFDRADCHGGRRDRAPALAPHIHPDYFAGYARESPWPAGRIRLPGGGRRDRTRMSAMDGLVLPYETHSPFARKIFVFAHETGQIGSERLGDTIPITPLYF